MGHPVRRMTAVVRLAALAAVAAALAMPAPIVLARSSDAPAPRLLDPTPPIRDLGAGPTDRVRPSGRPYADGVVLVGFRKGASAASRAATRASVQASEHRRVSPLAPDLERLRIPEGVSVEQAVQALQHRRDVRFAEPDYVLTVDHQPGDPIYNAGVMWGMYGLNSSPTSAYGFGIAAGEAWNASQIGSSDVLVGVVDTGIDISHKDLARNIWTNPFETPGNGVDDDGNGYVDDVHGWDFFHDDATVYDSAAADYHGTHVAGTIGGTGANEEGVVGVNWAVTMIPAKFIDGEGFESGAAAALDYLTDLKTRHGLNIVATNNSWGGAEPSVALEDAINRGGDAGILFVAAAGNSASDLDATPDYPASFSCDTRFDDGTPRGFDCIISVAAITETGELASFSNYGASSVDIGAPGEHIASTYPGNNYVYLNGTSMAAPHVTGSLALLASCQVSPTAQGLETALYDDAVATPSLAGITTTGKRVHVGAMMADCDNSGPPRAFISARAGGTDKPAYFLIFFSEAITDLSPDDVSIGGTSTGWSITNFLPTGGATPSTVEVSASAPTPGTISLTLAAGSVTGVHTAGPAAAVTATTIVDTTPPTVSAPSASIRTGVSLSGTGIPIQLTWHSGDAESGVRFYEIHYSTDGGSIWFVLTDYFIGTKALLLVSPSGSLRFRVRATDWAGHVSSFATGPTFSPRLSQESSRKVSYSGTWSKGKRSSYSGGYVRYTSVGKRSATYTFTGRAVAFVTTLSATRGVVRIKVDGTTVARIDLGSSSTIYRRLVWTRTFPTSKTHKVQVVVVGGYGRVDVDAFAVLR